LLTNFIIAGGVATGTSFLSATLAQHPEVYLPKIQRPEPNFFHYSWKYNQGLDWYQHTWFHEVTNERAIGERSSLLLPSAVAPKRLKKHVPNIKLIFCLRNPIERAWGNYRFTVLEGLEPLTFDAALDCENERIALAEGKWAEVQPHAYLSRSLYSSSLREYFDLFSKDQILLLKSEDLGRYPHENIKRVCEFLGVNSSVKLPLPPNYSSPSVEDHRVQTQLRSYFGDRFPEIIESIRRENDLSELIQSAEDAQKIACLKANMFLGKAPLRDSTRLKLRQLLEPEILEMKGLVDFPIDDWV